MKILQIWNRLAGKPGGKLIFSTMFCLKAPYFSTIKPRFQALKPEYCKVTMKKRRSVLNHIGSVHAIAMCNLAEAAGGTMTDVTVSTTQRWIPKGMTVSYLKKATTDLVAVATPEAGADWTKGGEYPVAVTVSDTSGEAVLQALITMWLTPNKTARKDNAAAMKN